MSDWTKHIENPQAIRSLYSECPSLSDFDLIEVILDREGPCLRLRGNLSSFPSHPSPRWPVGANRVQITLLLSGIRALSVSGWSHENRGGIELSEAKSGGIDIVFESSASRIHCVAVGVDIETISAYVAADQG